MTAVAPRHVLVLADVAKGGTAELARQAADWLTAQGCSVEVVSERDSSLENCGADFVVVLGGDGSLLSAARRMGRNQLPTLGINRGRLGFLTAFEHDQQEEALAQALAGTLIEERRLLLHALVREPDGSHGEPVLGMNDGVVTRAESSGMITLRAWRGQTELATFRGDGLIVATAAGSTAYSLAAGGPVLTPDVDALVLTPLASHTLSARPLVLPVDDGVEIELVETSRKRHASFQIDGQVRLQVQHGGRAVLRPSPYRFRHLGCGKQHFFQVLRRKLGFADLPRQR